MKLTETQIATYQQLHLEIFGKPISKKSALEEAMSLLGLVRVLARKSYQQSYKYQEVKNVNRSERRADHNSK